MYSSQIKMLGIYTTGTVYLKYNSFQTTINKHLLVINITFTNTNVLQMETNTL